MFDARPWEYPWVCGLDLAFHCIALVHVDPAFAKYQLSLLCRRWFKTPTAPLPHTVDFSDVNPAGTGWAALEFRHRRRPDFDFLSRIFRQAAGEFTWWVNREDANGSNLFEGGSMGLDNIGRSIVRTFCARDTRAVRATGWMARMRCPWPPWRHLHGRAPPALDLGRSSSRLCRYSEALEAVGLWDDGTASSMTASCCPTAAPCPSGCVRWSR